MSRTFGGGRETVTYQKDIESDHDVFALVEEFVRNRFREGNVIASELADDRDRRYNIIWADEGQDRCPVTTRTDGDLVAYGAFTYEAKEHSVQTIWKNHFEIRRLDDGDVYIRVSNWYGPTVDTWTKEVERNELFV